MMKRRIDFFFVKSQGGGIRTKDCRSNENSFGVAHCCRPPSNPAALVQQQDVIRNTIWRFPCAPIFAALWPQADADGGMFERSDGSRSGPRLEGPQAALLGQQNSLATSAG